MKYNAALVLEGGGMRGVYSQGVVDYFLEKDLEFKSIYGVSAGVACGYNYIAKQPGRSFTISHDYGSDSRVVGLKSFLRTGSYFNLEAIYRDLKADVPFDQETFVNNDVEFNVGCFNVKTGKVDYFNKQDIEKSEEPLIASSSLPILSRMRKIGKEKYLDGGIVDSIPLYKALEDGNKKIVVILTNPSDYIREKESAMKLIKLLYFRYPKLIEAVSQRHIVYNKIVEKINEMEANKEIFVIRPEHKLGVTRYTNDPEVVKESYEQGKNDAKKLFPQLLEYLKDSE